MSQVTTKEKMQDVGVSDFEVFTWKIPNISSIPHEVDYFVQSPSFIFDGSPWILKMYPNGQSEHKSNGYIDLAIQRLQFQPGRQKVRIKMHCKDVFNREVNPVSRMLDSYYRRHSICVIEYMKNFKQCPDKWRLAPKDNLTLVFAFDKNVIREKELDTQSISGNEAVGKRFSAKTSKENPETGEIFNEYLEFKEFDFKICSKRPNSPSGFHHYSGEISFGNATWILKVFPSSWNQHSNKECFDVVLERLKSDIPDHHVMFQFQFSHASNKNIHHGSSVFNANNTQQSLISLELENTTTCLCCFLQMKMKKSAGFNLGFNTSLSELAPAYGNASGSATTVQHIKVLQDFKNLYQKQEDCDVVIKVKEKKFPVHRLILKARSPVLASVFRSDMLEKATGVLNIEDCDPSSFSDFLRFIYCGEIKNLSEKNVIDLFTVADKYDVPDLRAICVEFMEENLTVETFCDTIALALLHSESNLINVSTGFFAEHLQEIMVTLKWQSFLAENPIQANELILKALASNKK